MLTKYLTTRVRGKTKAREKAEAGDIFEADFSKEGGNVELLAAIIHHCSDSPFSYVHNDVDGIGS